MKKAISVYALSFLFVLISCTSGQTKGFYAEGHMTENGKTIHIKDSIATWEAGALKVFFFPFRLTKDDLKRASRGFACFIHSDKLSPDKSLWQYCPYGMVDISFNEHTKDKRFDDIRLINYMFIWLKKEGFTMNINRSRQKARDSIDTFRIEKNKNQDILEFSSKGNHTSSSDGTKYSWDLRTKTRIFAVKHESTKQKGPSVSELVEWLQGTDTSRIIKASRIVGNMDSKPKEAIPALIKALKHKSPRVRADVANSLGIVKEAVPALAGLLKDSHEYVRESAAVALWKIGPDAKAAIPALIEALKDDGILVRFFAAGALVKIDPTREEAIGPLVEVLNQKSGKAMTFRFMAADALEKIGTKEALEALKDYKE